MAFVRELVPNTPDSHQTSPGYVLTFVRWSNRSTANYQSPQRDSKDTGPSFLKVETALIVISDAINITVKQSKASHTQQFSATLLAGDVNYATAVAPGDFVLINMVDDQTKVNEIYEAAKASKPINKYGMGFKGIFKVKSVRKRIFTDPGSGAKRYAFNIAGIAFDEFNTTVYYNPILAAAHQTAGVVFLSAFANYWNGIIQQKNNNNVQSILKALIKATVGHGASFDSSSKAPMSDVQQYLLPKEVGQLLGRPTTYAADMYNVILGIWQSTGLNLSAKSFTTDDPSPFFNKGFSKEGKNFFSTGVKLKGNRQLTAQDFNMLKVWSLLQNYSNPVLNEMYTTFRTGPDGLVYPTVVARQKPFNTQHFKGAQAHTKFLDLPRWKIAPELIYSADLGKNDEARINFVQVFTRSVAVDPNYNQALQMAARNFKYDIDDVKRSGLRPYITTCNFDFNVEGKELQGANWSNLVADWVFDGHLKENGSIDCIGIQEPIPVGDNLEFDDIVYHIEGVTHSMQISADGQKAFRTKLELSYGISKESNAAAPIYPEMDFTDSQSRRIADQSKEAILPGYSDTQDIPSRDNGEETRPSPNKGFTLSSKLRGKK